MSGLGSKLLCSLLLALLLAGCVRPIPSPEFPVSPTLYFPFVPVSDYQWQATGYGRPWKMVGRDADLHNRGMWAYTWGPGNCLTDIPMIFSGSNLDAVWLGQCAATAPVVLVLNEPEWASQANMTPEESADLLYEVLQVWDTGAWCCGTLASHSEYFTKIIDAYQTKYGELPGIDGVHFHVYVNDGFGVADPLEWINRTRSEVATYLATMAKYGYTRVVVSECCLLGKYNEEVYSAVMTEYTQMLGEFPEIESIAWFSAGTQEFEESNLLDFWTGKLLPLGEQWLAIRWR